MNEIRTCCETRIQSNSAKITPRSKLPDEAFPS